MIENLDFRNKLSAKYLQMRSATLSRRGNPEIDDPKDGMEKPENRGKILLSELFARQLVDLASSRPMGSEILLEIAETERVMRQSTTLRPSVQEKIGQPEAAS